MLLGISRPASLISSPIQIACLTSIQEVYQPQLLTHSTTQPYPIVEAVGTSNPTIAERPVLLQPPSFLNSVKTALALLRGAKVQRGMMTANSPKMCKIITSPCTNGNLLARKVLMSTANALTAIINKEPCQRSY